VKVIAERSKLIKRATDVAKLIWTVKLVISWTIHY